ncbi:MAG TPA: hypothetical protein VL523_18420 [Terriglobia bacterium]|nr:hypothetical protein [Terriglobia bacterium]
MSGLVIEVQPNELTLESKDARTIKLTTFEDYTDQVAVGSQVTAWYYPQDSGEAVLKSLERPAEILFVPVSEIEQRVRRVIVLPNSQVPGVEGFCASLRDYLQAHLGWYVAPGYLAEEIRKRTETSGSTLAAIDPATGNFDLKTYLSKTEGVVQKVASETRSDAVLEVDVLPVQAPVTRMIASWDGVEEPVSGAGMRTLAKLSMFSHKGEVQAATVELKLWSAQGRLLWRNRRGLALLQVLAGRGNRLRERPLSEYLENAQAVQAWMKAAFKALPTATNSGSGPEGQRL